MYNQNGNVPFNWVSVQQSQNNNLVQTEDEIALPPRFGNAERPIATEITSYDYYGRYHDVPTCQVQSNAAIQGLSHRPIVNDHHNLVSTSPIFGCVGFLSYLVPFLPTGSCP
jgi:hypothetical protein